MQIVQDIWEALNEMEKESRLGAHVHYRLAEMFFSLSFNVFMMNGGASGREIESLYLQSFFLIQLLFNILYKSRI